jgi:long-chain acyl-CoA synthetase
MIFDFLLDSAKEFPKKTALIFENSQINYFDLNQKALSLARTLKKNKPCVVSLLLSNSIDFCISFFGILYSGNICHVIPTSISDSNLANQLKLTNPSIILSNSIFEKKLSRINLNEKYSFLDITKFDFKHNSVLDCEFDTSSDSSLIALILFSAGTTSVPKAVQLSHNNIENTVNRVTNYLNITSNDIDVISLPLSHSFGLGCLNCIIKSGGTAILHKNTINMPNVISSIKNYQATSFASTPTTFQQIIDKHKSLFQNSIDSVRYLLTNSSPMPNELTNNLLNILNDKKLYTYYGLTEASRSTFHLFKKNDKKINSVGKPLPEVKIKIFTDSHECLPLERGEIYIQGPHVSPGYLQNTSNKKTLDSDWLHTGDIGYFDNDGYLFLIGRKDDLINIGGEKVFPKEIEDIIGSMKEIDEVAVKGIPDKLLGQIVQAYIVTKQEMLVKDQDIVLFCKGKLENYKIPRIFTYLSKLPKNEQGKILRSNL